MRHTLRIDYDHSVLREDFEKEARLSSGKAAELCAMGRVAFLLAGRG